MTRLTIILHANLSLSLLIEVFSTIVCPINHLLLLGSSVIIVPKAIFVSRCATLFLNHGSTEQSFIQDSGSSWPTRTSLVGSVKEHVAKFSTLSPSIQDIKPPVPPRLGPSKGPLLKFSTITLQQQPGRLKPTT